MKKKLTGKVTNQNETGLVVSKKADNALSPDTLYPLNQMECPWCRTPFKGYTRNESQQCQECGQTYIVLKATRVFFALT